MGNRLSYFVVVQSDVLIGSAFLSTTEIGRYAVALQLATLPMTKVMGTINQIALPAVARQQQEPERVRQTVLKSVGLISLLAFPVLWGISALAPELVRVLLGSNWLEAVPALTILPLIVPLRMALGVLFTASLAMGNRQIDLLSTTANFVLLPGGFYVGAHWGLLGLCSAWLVSVPLAYAVSLPLVLRAMGIRARELVIEFAAPAMAAGGMYAAIATLRPAVAALPALVALVALSAVGGLLYLALMGLFSRRHLAIARNFGRSLLARDAPTLV
jgi:O-antigen/teichoic acid export membrane protein